VQRERVHFMPSRPTPTTNAAPSGDAVAGTSRRESPVESHRPTRVPRRALSTDERRALDELVRLGASLDSHFTAEELRSAFRSLARRYHPDRHPGATASERTRLSTLFSQVHEAYKDLQGGLSAAA
jgi:hypothetical protein